MADATGAQRKPCQPQSFLRRRAERSFFFLCFRQTAASFSLPISATLPCENATPTIANMPVVCSDNSGGLDRDEFKRALQIWGMDEEALNEVRTRSFRHDRSSRLPLTTVRSHRRRSTC